MFTDSARVISLVSGKGGVGKTTLLCEMAWSLSNRGKRILIIDGDMGLANVDVMFGSRAKGHLAQVIFEQRSVGEITTSLAPRIDLISGGSGLRTLNQLSALERQGLVSSLIDLQFQYDYVLIDTASGMSEFTFQLAAMSDAVIAVVTPDPASFTDAYAMVKCLNLDFKREHFYFLANQVENDLNGANLFRKFTEVTGRFLMLSLDYLGSVKFDTQVKKFIQAQKLPIRTDHQSQHSLQIQKVIDNLGIELGQTRHKSHFWNELAGVA